MAKRTCTRCHTEQSVENFKARGKICFGCKIKAAESVADREKVRKRFRLSTKPRECKRCHKVYTVDQFTATGKICMLCKWAAVEALPVRRAEYIRAATSRRKALRKRAKYQAEWQRNKRRQAHDKVQTHDIS